MLMRGRSPESLLPLLPTCGSSDDIRSMTALLDRAGDDWACRRGLGRIANAEGDDDLSPRMLPLAVSWWCGRLGFPDRPVTALSLFAHLCTVPLNILTVGRLMKGSLRRCFATGLEMVSPDSSDSRSYTSLAFRLLGGEKIVAAAAPPSETRRRLKQKNSRPKRSRTIRT